MPPWPSSMPPGSKLWLLNLGYLSTDASMILSGANQFAAHLPPQAHERRELIMIAGLISHPTAGLILFDCGSCEDVIKEWGQTAVECSPRTWEKGVHGLPEAIKATGAGEIKDVKAVVLSHLHLDHAGGLEWFFDTDVEIWVHEEELKYAFWTCATGIEPGMYLPSYLLPSRLNWKTFSGPSFNIFQGITLHLAAGHTEGSIIMEVELEKSGTVVLTGDLFHIKENYEDGRHQATLIRNYVDWHRNRLFVRNLVERKSARVVLGHEPSYFYKLKKSPEFEE